MRYIQLDWINNHPDDPVRIYSEIGDDGYELTNCLLLTSLVLSIIITGPARRCN